MLSPRITSKLTVCLAFLSPIVLPSAAWAQTNAVAGQRSEFVLNVPLDAIVWVNGARTYNSGIRRMFVTPPLTAGRKYSYDFRISWIEGGRSKEITRHVVFRPGQRFTFDMARPNWARTSRDLYLDPAAPAPWGTSYYLDPLNSPNYPNFLFRGSVLRPR